MFNFNQYIHVSIQKLIKYLFLIIAFVFTIGQDTNCYSQDYSNLNTSSVSSKIEYLKYNENLFNDLEKIKPIGKGAQGRSFLYNNKKTNKKYVLKTTTADNISHSNTIYEKFPEFLACKKLADFECGFIAKPLAYRQLSDDSAEILLEYAEGNESLDSLTIKEKKKVLKQILSVRKQLYEIGLIHCDILWQNLSIKKNINKKLGIKIFDFGRTNTVKNSYDKSDLMRASHPWIDVWIIYKAFLKAFSNDEKLINKLNKNIKNQLPNLYTLAKINMWENEEKRKYASEILKIPLDDYNKFIDIVEKWVDDIKT